MRGQYILEISELTQAKAGNDTVERSGDLGENGTDDGSDLGGWGVRGGGKGMDLGDSSVDGSGDAGNLLVDEGRGRGLLGSGRATSEAGGGGVCS